MKAIGASHHQVMFVFVIQSVIVSVFGVTAGLTLGLSAIYFRNDFLHFMNHLTGFELFPASIYGFGELPALLIPWDIAIICGGSLLICLVAAIAWWTQEVSALVDFQCRDVRRRRFLDSFKLARGPSLHPEFIRRLRLGPTRPAECVPCPSLCHPERSEGSHGGCQRRPI